MHALLTTSFFIYKKLKLRHVVIKSYKKMLEVNINQYQLKVS